MHRIALGTEVVVRAERVRMKRLIPLGVLVGRSVDQLDVLENICEVGSRRALLIILQSCLGTLLAKYLKRAISGVLNFILASSHLAMLTLDLVLPTLRLILMPGSDLPDSMCWQRALILSFLGLLGPFVDNIVELSPTGPSSEVRNNLLEVWHHPIALLGLCLPIE